jgi:hypothetical protein
LVTVNQLNRFQRRTQALRAPPLDKPPEFPTVEWVGVNPLNHFPRGGIKRFALLLWTETKLPGFSEFPTVEWVEVNPLNHFPRGGIKRFALLLWTETKLPAFLENLRAHLFPPQRNTLEPKGPRGALGSWGVNT